MRPLGYAEVAKVVHRQRRWKLRSPIVKDYNSTAEHESRRKRTYRRMPTALVWALYVLGSAGLVGAVYLIMNPLTDFFGGDIVRALSGTPQADAIDAVRKTLLQSATAILVALALIFTARTYLLGREGQVTDRYTKAVDQLAKEEVILRAGGVFALERVMRYSKRDHWAIVEVLATFLRTTKVGPKYGDKGFPDADMKAALLVLGRRPRRKELDCVRLHDADLRSTLMRSGVLERAVFRQAQLDEIHWENARLGGAKFNDATMMKADLEKADLTGADLTRARLVLANLIGANLTGANLTEAVLVGADLTRANLNQAILTGAHLTGAEGADLTQHQMRAAHCYPSREERSGSNGNSPIPA